MPTISYAAPVPRAAALLLAAASLAVPSALGAQATTDSTRLPALVVTADRVPLPLDRTTSSVTILSGEALRAAGVVHVVDALRQVPGVHVARAGSAGAQASLFLRGGESDFVRVLVDGVAQNDPGGAIDLSTLTTDHIDRIEIVRGPASVLYGSDAVGGVVQIFTRQPRERAEARLALRAGSRATTDIDASLGAKGGPGSLALGLARHTTDGALAFNNEYRGSVASLRATALLPGMTSVGIAARHGESGFHYPTDGAGAVVDRNARRGERRTGVSADVARPLGAYATAFATLGALDLRGRTRDERDSAADTLGFHAYRSNGVVRRRHADLRLDLRPAEAITVSLGGEYAGEGQRSADSSNYDVGVNRFSARRITRAAYAQLLGAHGRLSYSVGARYDDNDTYGSFRTGRGSAALTLWEGGRVRASFGTAFKAPTFLETFSTAFSVGNAALRPERSRSWEAGLTQRLLAGRVEIGATYFDQRFRDLIQYTFRSAAEPNYFNVAAASSRGVELDARARVADGLAIFGNATALRTRVDDAGFQEGSGPGTTFVRGERLLRRPPLTATVGASVDRIPRARLELSVTRVGARDDRDFASFPARAVELDAYTRADIGGEYRLGGGPRWRASALTWRVENALGAGYEEIAGFRAVGRTILLGARLGTAP